MRTLGLLIALVLVLLWDLVFAVLILPAMLASLENAWPLSPRVLKALGAA